ncbi:MAG: LEA type 2 family protein [Granulosicoccus sp.]|nr:LEA type 2 family protein [Granulosicoccus sp.]
MIELPSASRASLRSVLVILALCSSLWVSACASIPTSKPLPPAVQIVSVKPVNLSLKKAKLEFKLRVLNPNAFALPLQQLDFIASFAGDQIANGASRDAVTIPAKGEAMLNIAVATELSKLFGQLKNMVKAKEYDVAYGVKGSVKLANWPKRIPFNVEGELEEPSLELTN